MVSDANVELLKSAVYEDVFTLNEQIKSVRWLDNNEELTFEQEENQVTVYTVPYRYGNDLVVRVAKIEVS